MQQSEKPLQAARQSEPASHRHAAANAASAQFDNSPRAVQLRATAQMLRESPQAKSLQAMAARMAAHGPAPVQRMGDEEEPLQGRFETAQRMEAGEDDLQMNAAPALQRQAGTATSPNRTGLPDGLKSGVEAMSGLSMDHVRVHYNSSQPAQLNALAYAQGSDIHIAPGQEQHLPHEAWHVVQQAQGRVQPTMQMKHGVPVNDDAGLEREADMMGAKALNRGAAQPAAAPGQARRIDGFGTSGSILQARRRFRGVPLVLADPDVGTHLSTLLTPTHATFVDIVIFILRNNPGFNEIHVHRGAGGAVVQISKKQTGQVGNGTAVAAGTALYNEATAKAANH